jgi:hypothetical protein
MIASNGVVGAELLVFDSATSIAHTGVERDDLKTTNTPVSLPVGPFAVLNLGF